MMMGGFDDMEGTSLYHMDYLGAMVKCDYAAFGYGGMLTLSIMDRYKATSIYCTIILLYYLTALYNFITIVKIFQLIREKTHMN